MVNSTRVNQPPLGRAVFNADFCFLQRQKEIDREYEQSRIESRKKNEERKRETEEKIKKAWEQRHRESEESKKKMI